MTGRMSMEQAKTIKQKRELAQELGMLDRVYACFVRADEAMFAFFFSEDVQQFEKAVLGRSSRSRSQITAKGAAVEEDDSDKDKGSDSEDEDEEEADPAPRRRPVSLMCSHSSHPL